MKNPCRIRSVFVPMFFLGIVSCGRAAVAPTMTPAPTITPTATATPSLQPGNYERNVEVDGVERIYLLHIPKGFDSLEPIPVVFVFHGWSGHPEDMDGLTDFNFLADHKGFLVVYPRGTGTSNSDLSWNAGACCGEALAENVDEPAFVRQMLADLGTLARIDPKRTYATGFSNGAFLSYRLGCEMSETFAAIAPVGGVLVFEPCQPAQPVSVMHVHGLYDATVPFEGGGELQTEGFPSVQYSIDAWVRIDGCTGSPQTDKPFSSVTHTVYGSCRAGTSVELYAIDYYGHRWPVSPTFPGSLTIWDFFAAHPMQ